MYSLTLSSDTDELARRNDLSAFPSDHMLERTWHVGGEPPARRVSKVKISMKEFNCYHAPVDAWIREALCLAGEEKLIAFAERSLTAIWERMLPALGEVQLGAIMDRVLCNAAKRHPILAGIKRSPDGFTFDGFSCLPDTEIAFACVELFAELLFILSKLTGGILLPALSSELGKISPWPDAHPPLNGSVKSRPAS